MQMKVGMHLFPLHTNCLILTLWLQVRRNRNRAICMKSCEVNDGTVNGWRILGRIALAD